MDHKLRVLVRLDIDRTSAVIEVSGCLTADSCTALLPLFHRMERLAHGMVITVDLSDAQHIERRGLEVLERFGAGEEVGAAQPGPFTGTLAVAAPADLPQCSALSIGRARLQGAA